MQQPIYWPDKLPSNPNTYQKAYDSMKLKSSQGDHPQDNIDDVFGKGKACIIQSLDGKRLLDVYKYRVDTQQSHEMSRAIAWRPPVAAGGPWALWVRCMCTSINSFFYNSPIVLFVYTDDRVNDYQHYAADAVQSCQQYADMGAQVRTISSYPCSPISSQIIEHLLLAGQLQWLSD